MKLNLNLSRSLSRYCICIDNSMFSSTGANIVAIFECGCVACVQENNLPAYRSHSLGSRWHCDSEACRRLQIPMHTGIRISKNGIHCDVWVRGL